MTLTLTDSLLLLFGGLSFVVFVWLVFLKQEIKKTSIYKNQKVYNLGRFCLAILSFCLTVLSSNQLFQTSSPLILLIYSFIAVTSLQIFWWNLTYNAQEDPLSSLFLKKEQRLDLRKADLRKAYLRKAYLRGADLRKANLRGANLSEADLRGANLSMADLRGADLRKANLSMANLSMADLRGADLRGANLSEADLSMADLREAYLSMAYRTSTYFERAWLENTSKVEGANFTNTKGISPEQRAILIARGAIFNDFS
jgi:uncharacterized protein YjbI with pentapeptide repeats